MQKNPTRLFGKAGLLVGLAVIFTILTKLIDVQTIGPQGSAVGFAAINEFVHNFFGVHMLWYHITDWLGLIPVFTAFIFAVVGLVQLIRRRSLLKVDKSILILGGFYILVIAVYLFFESCIINYRPILMNGFLEASYPSSHTLMTICLMLAAVTECSLQIKSQKCMAVIKVLSYAVIAVTIIGRLISGVHWFTDIVGGILISAALLMLYHAVLSAVLHTSKS